MPDKRNQLNLYDQQDVSKNFQIDHNNGVIEVRVPDSSNMTVSGKATFDAGSTCIIRDNEGVLCGVGGTSLLHTSINVNDLGNDNYQLADQFSVNYSGVSFYVDGDLDNKISGGSDITIPIGAPNSVGTYIDPQHYILSIDANGFKPYFNSQPLANADNVTWALSYVDTPGDATTIRSTILSGSFVMNGSVYKLSVNGGMEWPVNGWDANREGYWVATTGAPSGIPLGSHIAADIADFVGFYFNPNTLELSAFCQSEDSLESIFDTIDSSMSTLTSNLVSETTRAGDAETVLDNKLDTEIAALTATDAAHHATILAGIATEVARAQQAESSLQVSLDNEQVRAEASEQTILNTVAALTVTETANDSAHQTAIDNEVARATASEAAIQADEDSNEQAASDALVLSQTTLQSNIDSSNTNLTNQSASAQAVEANIQSQISNILSNIDPVSLSSLSEIISHFSSDDADTNNLINELLQRIVNTENVLNCLLDPDLGELDPVLKSLYDLLHAVSVSINFDSPEAIQIAADGSPPTANPTDSGLGWYYKNQAGNPVNKINWYFASNLGMTMNDISYISIRVKVYNTVAVNSFPFLTIYTTGTANGWYQSRFSFLLKNADIQNTSDGDTILMYHEMNPLSQDKDVPHYELEQDSFSSVGPLLGNESIFLIALSTDSSAATDNVEIAVDKFTYSIGDNVSVFNLTS